MKLFFFDTETTGTQPWVDYIIQLWGIFWEMNEEDFSFNEMYIINQLINVDVKIPEWATAVHGIKNEDLIWYEKIDKYIYKFLAILLEADYVVGHNIEFDKGMLLWEASRLWISFDWSKIKWIDTMKPCAELVNWVWWKRPKLIALHEFLFWKGFDWAHDAMADIRATKDCFLELCKKYHFYENWVFKGKITNSLKDDFSHNDYNDLTRSPILELSSNSIYWDMANLDWKDNREAVEVLKILTAGKKSLFLTGKAWTWKSTLIKWIIWANNVRHKYPIILWSTWISALNIWWQTIHSFFWLWHSDVYYKDISKIKRLKISRSNSISLKKCPFVIIDEISMVNSNTIDVVDTLMRKALNNDSPFWWKQMLFVWDIFQLPPVCKDGRTSKFGCFYKSEWFFHSDVFKILNYDVVELVRNYRQWEDQQLSIILDHIREWNIMDKDLVTLNWCILNKTWDDSIVLFSHNKDVDNYNQKKLNELPWETYHFSAYISWDYPESLQPMKDEIVLKKWARVMMLNNDSDKRWVNWSIWKIIDVVNIWENPYLIVEIDGDEYEVVEYTRKYAPLVYDIIKEEFVEDLKWTYTQFPVKLAYAITIHKSQWLTFDKCKMDIWKVFVWWQAYTALSRVRSLSWLSLNSIVEKEKLFFDSRIKEFRKNVEILKEWNSLCMRLPSPTLLTNYTKTLYQWWNSIRVICLWYEDKIKLILSKFKSLIIKSFMDKFWLDIHFFFNDVEFKNVQFVEDETINKEDEAQELKQNTEVKRIVMKNTDCYMYEQKLLHKNAYEKRRNEDDEKLLELYKNWKSINELCKIFERNNWSIKSRLRKLWVDLNRKSEVNCDSPSQNLAEQTWDLKAVYYYRTESDNKELLKLYKEWKSISELNDIFKDRNTDAEYQLNRLWILNKNCDSQKEINESNDEDDIDGIIGTKNQEDEIWWINNSKIVFNKLVYPRTWKKWTAEEITRAISMVNNWVPVEKIVETIGRSITAILSKLSEEWLLNKLSDSFLYSLVSIKDGNSLNLSFLDSLSEQQANILINYKWDVITLYWLKILESWVASILSKFKWKCLYLNWLKYLSEEDAFSLSQFKWDIISLKWLDMLDSTVIDVLNWFKWEIVLSDKYHDLFKTNEVDEVIVDDNNDILPEWQFQEFLTKSWLKTKEYIEKEKDKILFKKLCEIVMTKAIFYDKKYYRIIRINRVVDIVLIKPTTKMALKKLFYAHKADETFGILWEEFLDAIKTYH